MYSEILNTHLEVTMTKRGQRLIDQSYGLDNYLLEVKTSFRFTFTPPSWSNYLFSNILSLFADPCERSVLPFGPEDQASDSARLIRWPGLTIYKIFRGFFCAL